MVTLEVRRHTMRVKPGQHLSHKGVSLARTVGLGIGPFDRVASSNLPRAIETAIAMGTAVDDVIEDLGRLWVYLEGLAPRLAVKELRNQAQEHPTP